MKQKKKCLNSLLNTPVISKNMVEKIALSIVPIRPEVRTASTGKRAKSRRSEIVPSNRKACLHV
jgi:hypothetical protein